MRHPLLPLFWYVYKFIYFIAFIVNSTRCAFFQFFLSFSLYRLSYCWLPVLYWNSALFILLVKSSLTRWHWWLLFFFHLLARLTTTVWAGACVCSVAFNHFYMLPPIESNDSWFLFIDSFIHLFYIHSTEHNGGEKA